MSLDALRSDSAVVSPFDGIDGRVRFCCGILTALSLAALKSWPALAVGVSLPFVLVLFYGIQRYWPTAWRMLIVGAITTLLIGLTWTGGSSRIAVVFSPEGTMMGLKIAARLLLISACLVPLVTAMGVAGIETAMAGLGVAEKFRILLLLMLRYSLMMAQTTSDKMRALHLRGPEAPLLVRLNGHACSLGSSLVGCSDRGERSWQALQCRGGLAGFNRARRHKIGAKEYGLIAVSAVWTAVVWGVELWLC